VNAYELADINDWSCCAHVKEVSAMLRQQADRIAELEKEKIRAYDNGYEDGQKFWGSLKNQCHGYTTPQIKELSARCIVKDCENHKHQGSFTGELCNPCYEYITTNNGKYSQAYRNAQIKELSDEEIWEVIDNCFGVHAFNLDYQIALDEAREDAFDLVKTILKKASEK
jgi:hypothetical protein